MNMSLDYIMKNAGPPNVYVASTSNGTIFWTMCAKRMTL